MRTLIALSMLSLAAAPVPAQGGDVTMAIPATLDGDCSMSTVSGAVRLRMIK